MSCGRPAQQCDLDQTIPAPAGATAEWNLAPLCRGLDHWAKTRRYWRLEQPEPGRFVWTSNTGHVYHIDPEAVGPIIEPVSRGDPGLDEHIDDPVAIDDDPAHLYPP